MLQVTEQCRESTSSLMLQATDEIAAEFAAAQSTTLRRPLAWGFCCLTTEAIGAFSPAGEGSLQQRRGAGKAGLGVVLGESVGVGVALVTGLRRLHPVSKPFPHLVDAGQ